MHFAVRRIVRACTTLFAIPVLFACKSDGSGPIVPPPTPSISISVAPATLELNQGANGTVTVTVTRSGGFTGAVTVAVEGLPTGVTIPGITIASGAASGTLNVSAAAAAAAATSTLTIRATGTGVTAATASLSLTVRTVSTPVPAFAIGLSAGTASIAAGASANVTVNVTRTGGFTGAVGLAVTGAPAGMTTSFNPASVTGASSTLTVNAGAAVAAGTYPLTVRGTAAGLTDQTATLTVTVTGGGGGGGGGSANWVFCGSTGLPLWFAFQDGTGAWTRVVGVNNAYSFTINGTRGGVAYVVPIAGGGFDLEVFYGTKAEIETQGGAICAGASGPGVTVNGTIAGAAQTDLVLIGMAKSIGVTAAGNTTFTIPGVPTGSFDLLSGKSAFTISGTSVTLVPNKFFIRRNVNSGAATAIDFNGADAFDPATANVTVNNLAGEETRMLMSYFTANSLGSFYVDPTASAGATRAFFGVPAGRQVGTDFHYLNVIATPAGVLQPTSTRQAGVAFKTIGNQTVTLGPTMTAPTVTALAGARLRAVYTVQAEYNKFFIGNFQQTGANARIASILMTGAYLQGGGTATLEVPDVVPVTGFDANWMLRSGTSTVATVTATGWPGAGGITSSPLTEGAVYASGTRMSSINTN